MKLKHNLDKAIDEYITAAKAYKENPCRETVIQSARAKRKLNEAFEQCKNKSVLF